MTQVDFSRPFVFFRKPGTHDVHYWKSISQAQEKSIGDIIKSADECWVCSPFSFYETGKIWTFIADEKHIFHSNKIDQILIPSVDNQLAICENIDDTKELDFKQWVSDAAAEMQRGSYDKIALSKIRKKDLDTNFDWTNWFNAACEKFPNALIFFMHMPNVFTWAGSTPELFLSVKKNKINSVSLAGTLHPDSPTGWTEKERQEQLFVTDYIRELFVKSGFKNVKVSEPGTINIGKLSHLKTSFEAEYNNDENELSQLIQNMHPTPAVGGLPKEEGLKSIREKETHERNLYSGFLGTKSANKELDLYVNLRSMRVYSAMALLYAGAGITAQSNPELEWLETENKLRMNMDLL